MRAKLGLGQCPAGSGKLWASSDLPVAVSRQQTLGSLRVTSRSRYGEGVDGSEGWTASGGWAYAALRDAQTTDIKSTNYSSHALLRQTAPVPSYIRARPDAGHRGERRGYLALADATRPATRPCSSRGHSEGREPHSARPTKSACCVLGMSHICITLYTKACYIARGRHDDRPLGAYTCRRLARSLKAYHLCLCPFCAYRPREYQSSEHVLIVCLPSNHSSDPCSRSPVRPSLLSPSQF